MLRKRARALIKVACIDGHENFEDSTLVILDSFAMLLRIIPNNEDTHITVLDAIGIFPMISLMISAKNEELCIKPAEIFGKHSIAFAKKSSHHETALEVSQVS